MEPGAERRGHPPEGTAKWMEIKRTPALNFGSSIYVS